MPGVYCPALNSKQRPRSRVQRETFLKQQPPAVDIVGHPEVLWFVCFLMWKGPGTSTLCVRGISQADLCKWRPLEHIEYEILFLYPCICLFLFQTDFPGGNSFTACCDGLLAPSIQIRSTRGCFHGRVRDEAVIEGSPRGNQVLQIEKAH